jgi:hypothetical protein
MIYLLEYDPPKGKLLTFTAFDPRDREKAADARLARELELFRRGIRHEVVLLEASDEEALRRTHGRYFYSLREIAEGLLPS